MCFSGSTVVNWKIRSFVFVIVTRTGPIHDPAIQPAVCACLCHSRFLLEGVSSRLCFWLICICCYLPRTWWIFLFVAVFSRADGMKRLEFSLCWLGWSWCCRLIPWNPRVKQTRISCLDYCWKSNSSLSVIGPRSFSASALSPKRGITSQSIVAMLLRFYVIFFFI